MEEENHKNEIEDEEETEEKEARQKKPVEKLEKINLDKLRGRVIILNPEESEFAKNLGLIKKGDYSKKKV